MKKLGVISLVLLAVTVAYSQTSDKKHVTICWDTSYSMGDRNLNKDFEVLSSLFKPDFDYKVQLLQFDVLVAESSFEITNGDWSSLRAHLENTVYDGGTIYTNINDRIKGKNVYMFTDGHKLLDVDRLILPKGSIVINSHPNRNVKFLEKTALLYRSRLMDFASVLPENVKKIGKSSENVEVKTTSLLKGKVFLENKAVPNAIVMVQGHEDGFFTDTNGNFEVPAEVGDTLIVSVRGGKKTFVPVEVLAHTSVFLDDGSIKLDEVVVTENRDVEQVMVNTGLGKRKKESLGYTVSTVGDEDINDSESKLHEALDGKVSGMNVTKSSGWDNRSTLGRTLIRGANSINMNNYALVVIDGIPVESTNKASAFGANDLASGITIGPNEESQREALFDHINPDNIAEVTVLKGLAATNRFGTLGANGVIMITTKTASHPDKKNGKYDNPALLKNNEYNEDGYSVDSPFYKAFYESKNSDEAYQTYLSLRGFNETDTAFFLDAFSYFKENDPDLALKVISNLLETKADDITALKIVALCASTLNKPEMVLLLNNDLMAKEPNNVNAHYQTSLARLQTGEYQGGLDYLLDLRFGKRFFSVNAAGITKTLDRDIKNVIYKKGNLVDKSRVNSSHLNNVTLGARLVFEWNDPAAQFEIQFVNPQKRFFNWEYSNGSDRQRITEGIQKNYAIEEFEIFSSDKGEWLINAAALGDGQLNKIPLVLKCTIYEDFGRPNQKSENLVLHFEKDGQKRKVKKLVIR